MRSSAFALKGRAGVLDGLTDVRSVSRQRYSRADTGDSGVRRPARRTPVRRRGRVLPQSPRLGAARSADGRETDRVGHLWSSSSRRAFALEEQFRLRSRSSSGRSRPSHPRISVPYVVADRSPPCLARASRRDDRTASVRLAQLRAILLFPLLTQRFVSDASIGMKAFRCPWMHGLVSRPEGRGVPRMRNEDLRASEASCAQPVISPRQGRLKTLGCLRGKAQIRETRLSGSVSPRRDGWF